MGVPKFFRYISERYPCLSELVKEYQIPEFDNLYLDMNGIIHMCSHPDDFDPHFRISEEKIFADIFHYIEVLFRMIKPQKLFFMAIDGVAPRAKMNQQRGRRFRSAKDAEKLEAKAKERGEALPDDARFDSNCITPGTVFMARLQEQLKYFVINKITNDKLWQNCKVILSGHETPGEGEHKIMDYIRYLRAQPGYDPNTRHCLYGLDADLIMLGLCTHEPHFSLLREEVRFGKKNNKRKSIPEQISFYLLHLSLMREYLELEFINLKTTLSFNYNIENIIDDWVLMGFLVGNDFIPHLPNLHIANGALPLLYSAYMKVLPSLDGYINEGGHLHLDRFEKFMEALQSIDMEAFSEHYADLQYFESKTGRRPNEKERTSYKPKKMEPWQGEGEEEKKCEEPLEPEKPVDSGLAALIKKTNDMLLEPSEENLATLANDETNEDDLIDYLDSDCETPDEDENHDLLDEEFQQHKKHYYMDKLEYEQVTPEVLRSQAEGYVRAIQWNLHYYYNSVCSWSWYYPHHYAPFISDIKGFQDLKLEYDLGEPFKPYEQLLAVLPAASKNLLPDCYHHLMLDESSVIKDYYPLNFNTDLNGKKQDWEAVVLIPFIDEKRLLEAMATRNDQLTEEEVKRNTHGPMLLYEFTELPQGDYEAPEYFPVIKNHLASCTLIWANAVRVPLENLIKGAYPGAIMDVYYPGFPTMKHLKYTSSLERAKVKVFDQPSRGENMILKVGEVQCESIELLAKELLGKTVFVAWPHLIEAMVISVSNKNFRYHKAGNEGGYNVEENRGNIQHNWDSERHGITEYYRDRLGVEVGNTEILVHVKVMIGRKYIFTPQGRVNLEKQWSEATAGYPLQVIVRDISVYNPKFALYKNIEDIYIEKSYCFMLGQPHYGCLGTVLNSVDSLKKFRVKISFKVCDEPNFSKATQLERSIKVNYMTLYTAASRLGISRHLLSRITGCIFVILGPRRDTLEDTSKINIGLNLKYNKKNEEIPGYTKKEKEWLYSQKAVDLVSEFMALYPNLLHYLNSRVGDDMYYEYEIFPEDEGSGKTVKLIAEWIKNQPPANIERQSCGSHVLEPDVVKEMENCVDEYVSQQKFKTVVMQVKPHLLYKPDIQMGNMAPDSTATYHLYDRVVNIRESYTVPIGYTGTVIAVHKPSSGNPEDTMYDIMFDKPFAGGLALNCSPNRGYRMSKFSLINRSHGMRQKEEKTGKPGELIQQLNSRNGHPNYSQGGSFPNYQSQNSAFASWNNLGQQAPPAYPYANPNPNHGYQMNAAPNVNQQFYQAQPRGNNYFTSSPEKKISNQKPFDFMPSFKDGKAEVPPNPNKVDTNLLKKMLKIGDEEKPKTILTKPSVNEGIQLSVQEIFEHASAKINEAKEPYSLQLLSYYQTQGMGCPHYKYFDLPDGKCQAQLLVSFNNQLIFGESADNKEEACENVAKLVLQQLKEKPKNPVTPNLPVKFPSPPKQWCDPENKKPKNTSPQKQAKGPPHVNKPNILKKDVEKTKPLSLKQEFVPLQAVKQHRINKGGHSSEDSNKRDGNQSSKGPKDNKTPTKSESKSDTENVTKTSAAKPRRERKMRIAANFSTAPKIQK